MLENVAEIFDNSQTMLKKLKKSIYETNMKNFREKYGHYFDEMTEVMESVKEDEKLETAENIASVFVEAIKDKYEIKGKIKGKTQADLNFFMIYYVFPAILLTEYDKAEIIADAIRDKWRTSFKNSQISYTDYDTLYKSFREKILGIF